ncbi:MAG: metallophosphoesterase family protein [Sphingomonadales bacterium]|nr:metallophosphoesterase family protein [Sphingomonadales bacterium]
MIAIFSDIHGNLPALEACYADALARGCTLFLNLGDILSGPLWPRETADWLMQHDWPTISGNHDRELVGGDRATMGRADTYALAELGERHLGWLRTLPPTLQWREDVYLCHGNPADDMHYLMHRVEPDRIRDAHEGELHEMLAGQGTHAIACGHSHLPRLVVLGDGRQVFNPGSVGLPAYAWDFPHVHRMELGSTHARYAVLSGEGEGIAIDLVAVDYDHKSAADRAETNGRMDWAVPLRTGFVD